MMKLGLIFLSLCGWWVFSAIIVGPEWKRKDGGDLPGPPSGLEREKELITTQLNQALQVMGEPSIINPAQRKTIKRHTKLSLN
jgi:hypothetical protein